jgi:hypothetical protein
MHTKDLLVNEHFNFLDIHTWKMGREIVSATN